MIMLPWWRTVPRCLACHHAEEDFYPCRSAPRIQANYSNVAPVLWTSNFIHQFIMMCLMLRRTLLSVIPQQRWIWRTEEEVWKMLEDMLNEVHHWPPTSRYEKLHSSHTFPHVWRSTETCCYRALFHLHLLMEREREREVGKKNTQPLVSLRWSLCKVKSKDEQTQSVIVTDSNYISPSRPRSRERSTSNPSRGSDNDHDENALNHVLYDITEAHLLRSDGFIAQT